MEINFIITYCCYIILHSIRMLRGLHRSKEFRNSQINNRQKNNFYSNVVWLSVAVLIISSYLLSFLTFYHVSPRSTFIAGMSPWGWLFYILFPRLPSAVLLSPVNPLLSIHPPTGSPQHHHLQLFWSLLLSLIFV